jgi:hypothetical protein
VDAIKQVSFALNKIRELGVAAGLGLAQRQAIREQAKSLTRATALSMKGDIVASPITALHSDGDDDGQVTIVEWWYVKELIDLDESGMMYFMNAENLAKIEKAWREIQDWIGWQMLPKIYDLDDAGPDPTNVTPKT